MRLNSKQNLRLVILLPFMDKGSIQTSGEPILPVLDIGEEIASKIVEKEFSNLEARKGVRTVYEPQKNKFTDKRSLNELEEALDSLEDGGESTIVVWDHSALECGDELHDEGALLHHMKKYPNAFNVYNVDIDPVNVTRGNTESTMRHVTSTIEDMPLDGETIFFDGFDYGGFSTLYFEPGQGREDIQDQIQHQIPRFSGYILSTFGKIAAGFISPVAYEGGSREFGISVAMPSSYKKELVDAYSPHEGNPESEDIEDFSDFLAGELEQKLDTELVENEYDVNRSHADELYDIRGKSLLDILS